MNLAIREFEQTIINFINQSPIPIETKRLVIKDIFYQIEKASDEVIKQEIQIKKEQENKDKEEATE